MYSRTLRIISLVACVCAAKALPVQADAINFEHVASLNGGRGSAVAQNAPFRFSLHGEGINSTGAVQISQEDNKRVETVNLDDVTGTVCDCGEIEPVEPGAVEGAKGKFPKFPLLALAVLPGALCCRRNEPRPPPPPPPPSTVPEPLSLLTFASGVGIIAALRRRRAKQ